MTETAWLALRCAMQCQTAELQVHNIYIQGIGWCKINVATCREQGWVREGSWNQNGSNYSCSILLTRSPCRAKWSIRCTLTHDPDRRAVQRKGKYAKLYWADATSATPSKRTIKRQPMHFAPSPLSPCVASRTCICASVSACLPRSLALPGLS